MQRNKTYIKQVHRKKNGSFLMPNISVLRVFTINLIFAWFSNFSFPIEIQNRCVFALSDDWLLLTLHEIRKFCNMHQCSKESIFSIWSFLVPKRCTGVWFVNCVLSDEHWAPVIFWEVWLKSHLLRGRKLHGVWERGLHIWLPWPRCQHRRIPWTFSRGKVCQKQFTCFN